MEEIGRPFIPAAGRDWRLPFYDPFVKLIGADAARRALIDRAAIRPGQRVLDLGCGTGSLALAIARVRREVDVVGVDPDRRALARATAKAARAGASIRFDHGYADRLPYAEATFDRVLSSFVYHHLRGEEKAAMFREVRRVLRPGGSVVFLDFAGPEAHADHLIGQWLRSRPLLRDNAEDRILSRMSGAGFEDPRRVGGGSVVFGLLTYSCFAAASPAEEAR